MNRADLDWALDAVLPHVGKHEWTAGVGFHDGHLFATDRYSIGVSRIADAPLRSFFMSTREATDLMRYVRPKNKTEQAEELTVGFRELELHIGLEDGDSAVFELTEMPYEFGDVMNKLAELHEAPREFTSLIYQPKLFSRFAKAQRNDGERLHIYPCHLNDKHGAALVTVGEHFIGGIAGLTYEQSPEDETVSSFLQMKGKAA